MIHGVGIELVEAPRFKNAIDRFGERLLKRVFTEGELAYCLKQRNPERFLAARYAAKVSFSKALGRPVRFKDVEVTRDGGGRPSFCVKGMSDIKASLSITHDGDLSLAETILEK